MKLTGLNPYPPKDQTSNHRAVPFPPAENGQSHTNGTLFLRPELPNKDSLSLRSPGKRARVSARPTLADRLENAPPSVQKLIRRIQFCCDRGLYDLAVLSCRSLFEVAIFEFLRKNVFPQLNASQLFSRSLQFWVDSLCRWAPPIWLSNESCEVIRQQAVRLGEAAAQQMLKEKPTENSSRSGSEVIVNTLKAVRLLFPAGAERH